MFNETEGPSPKDMGLDETRNQNQPFREKTVVNGIEMGVGLGSQDYEIYFPDVEISPEEGIYDELIKDSRSNLGQLYQLQSKGW